MNNVFTGFDVYAATGMSLQTAVGTERAETARASAGFFATLGVSPELGRAIEDTAAPIVEGGKIVGVVLVFHDVTARREARRKLDEAQSRMEEIMARMSVPSARITLRLPESLNQRVESAAAREGASVNTWLVQALQRAVESHPHRSTSGSRNRLTGYGRT